MRGPKLFMLARRGSRAGNVDNLFNRRYLNTALTDTDYFGNPFVRGIIAPPRRVTGSVDVTF